MVTHLYRNFLTDPSEYAASEAFWASLWANTIARADLASAWRTSWLRTTFADGTKMADGNPIFSAICPTRNLAVRVIQHEPDSDELDLTWWEDSIVDPATDGVTVERVIACALSIEAAQQAAELIAEWISVGSAVQSLPR